MVGKQWGKRESRREKEREREKESQRGMISSPNLKFLFCPCPKNSAKGK